MKCAAPLALALPAMAQAAAPSSTDAVMERAGMVDARKECPALGLDLMYAGDGNFTGRTLYRGITAAWLHPRAAKALAKAQAELQRLMPGARLVVKDAARPMSVQRAMYRAVQGTPMARYVADPAHGGGLHNYGMAVDITVADANGNELDMGTPVDHLGPAANIDREQQLVARGVISENARQNRLMLRRAMLAAGFRTIRTEWWHFNCTTLADARAHLTLIE